MARVSFLRGGRSVQKYAAQVRPQLEPLEDRTLLSGGLSFIDPPLEFAAGRSPRSVAVADFNADGNPDLAIANFDSNDVSVFLGNGNGTLRLVLTVAAGTNPYFITSADLNGDAVADLVVANSGSNNVSILLGNGDGSFRLPRNVAVGTRPRSIAVSDFNRDTIPDLAVANEGSNNVSILLGKGDGTFAPPRNITVPRAVFVAASDLDGDGIADLAVASSSTPPMPSTTSILLGNGDGTFRSSGTFTVGTNATSLVVSDFNGDAIPDLAVASRQSDTVSILLGTGAAGFTPARNYYVGGFPSSIAAGDLNGDGIVDLVTANQFSSVSVLVGNGDGTFQPTQDFWGGADPVSVQIGDFNRDGRPDLAVANLDVNSVAMVLNNTLQPGDGVTILRDIVYYNGPGFNPQKHILDVYLPAGRTDFPVVFFLNGGGFQNGAKTRSGFLGRTLAREGIGVVMPDYRLTDGSPQQVVHPGHIEDVARAFAWMYSHVADLGGNLDQIVVMGHSAGANLAAMLATDPRWLAVHGLSPDVIKGVIGVSGGGYDLTVIPEFADIFGDAEQQRLASAITHVHQGQPPFLLMYGDRDSLRASPQTRAFFQAIVEANAEATLHEIPDRTHQTMIGRAARPGDPVRELSLRFIAEVTTPLSVVESVVVNDGSAQRSRVTSLTVTFSSAVTLDPGAFELLRRDGSAVSLNVATSVVAGRTVAVLTFSGPDILAGSLADGNYTLTIRGDRVHDSLGRELDGDGNGTLGGDRVEAFFRLYGDTDGDRDVDLIDLGRFLTTFGRRHGDSRFLDYLDFDGNGAVGLIDLFAFVGRLGTHLNP